MCCLTFNISGQKALTDSAYIARNYTKKEVYITTRDGVKLFTSIYSPKNTAKKYPILMSRTPYTVSPYGNKLKTAISNMTLVREGYIFVFQDVRGRWMSEGEYVNMRPHLAKKGPQEKTITGADSWRPSMKLSATVRMASSAKSAAIRGRAGAISS